MSQNCLNFSESQQGELHKADSSGPHGRGPSTKAREKPGRSEEEGDNEGEWEMIGLTISHSLRRSAWALRATTAGVGGFPLLAGLVYVADEYPAVYAGTGTLEASVVRLYGIVVIV